MKTTPERIGKIQDNDFAFLANNAAFEIDLLLREKDTSLDAVNELRNVLKATVENKNFEQCIFFDPKTSHILKRAYSSSFDQPVKTFSDIAAKAKEVSDQLGKLERVHDASFLTKVRDYCIALSETAFEADTWPNTDPHAKEFRALSWI